MSIWGIQHRYKEMQLLVKEIVYKFRKTVLKFGFDAHITMSLIFTREKYVRLGMINDRLLAYPTYSAEQSTCEMYMYIKTKRGDIFQERT